MPITKQKLEWPSLISTALRSTLPKYVDFLLHLLYNTKLVSSRMNYGRSSAGFSDELASPWLVGISGIHLVPWEGLTNPVEERIDLLWGHAIGIPLEEYVPVKYANFCSPRSVFLGFTRRFDHRRSFNNESGTFCLTLPVTAYWFAV